MGEEQYMKHKFQEVGEAIQVQIGLMYMKVKDACLKMHTHTRMHTQLGHSARAENRSLPP